MGAQIHRRKEGERFARRIPEIYGQRSPRRLRRNVDDASPRSRTRALRTRQEHGPRRRAEQFKPRWNGFSDRRRRHLGPLERSRRPRRKNIFRRERRRKRPKNPRPPQKNLKDLLLIGAGGFIGSVARYLLGGAVERLLAAAKFPFGTLTVNILGCFLIGVVGGLSGTARLFFIVGVLGGFTTFSSFGNETFALLRGGEPLKAFGNVALQVIVGLLAVWLGQVISRHV